jgi:hypothetical protein
LAATLFALLAVLARLTRGVRLELFFGPNHDSAQAKRQDKRHHALPNPFHGTLPPDWEIVLSRGEKR